MNFEIEIIKWLQSFRSSFLDDLFQFITLFGEELILIAVLGFVYWCYNKKTGELLGLTLFLSLIFNTFLKNIVMRHRPYVVDSSITPIRVETAGGYSFPSGHTQGAGTLFFGLYFFIKKRYLLIFAIIITVLVAISRMYLGVHFLTDVLVGGLLGLGFGYFGKKYLVKDFNYVKVYLYLFLGVTLVVFALIAKEYFSEVINSNSLLAGALFYNSSETIMKAYGTIAGFVFGIIFEKQYVNFANHKDIKKNIIRFLLGIGIILIVRYFLKYVFGLIANTTDSYIYSVNLASLALLLDFLRYFLMVFIGIGLYPKIFKKINI